MKAFYIISPADIHAHDKDCWTPLTLAAWGNPILDAMRTLLKAGADVNAQKSRLTWTFLALLSHACCRHSRKSRQQAGA
jgi:ankyrin repeat protein